MIGDVERPVAALEELPVDQSDLAADLIDVAGMGVAMDVAAFEPPPALGQRADRRVDPLARAQRFWQRLATLAVHELGQVAGRYPKPIVEEIELRLDPRRVLRIEVP